MKLKNGSTILGKLEGKTVIVEDNCYVGEDVHIVSDYIHLKPYVTIHGLYAKTPDKFVLGDCSRMGRRNFIECRSFEVGKYLWMTDDVEIGRGGHHGPNSIVKIGDGCAILEHVMMNPSEAVTIGNNVGIGTGVHIWTHGSYLDILQGFPASFKPVKIGNDVWLPDKIIVLPGIKIGNNVVVQASSVINKNLPDGCLAGGIPVEILLKNVFPKILTDENKKTLIEEILVEWKDKIVPFKGITTVKSVEYNASRMCIILKQDVVDEQTPQGTNYGETVFDTNSRSIYGYENDVTEDLRDYLRRRGIKFFTGKPFRSITPPPFA